MYKGMYECMPAAGPGLRVGVVRTSHGITRLICLDAVWINGICVYHRVAALSPREHATGRAAMEWRMG